MVNEEDHLRMQACAPGWSCAGSGRRIDRLDTEIEKQVDYAFSPRLGYLTACPTNVGHRHARQRDAAPARPAC